MAKISARALNMDPREAQEKPKRSRRGLEEKQETHKRPARATHSNPREAKRGPRAARGGDKRKKSETWQRNTK